MKKITILLGISSLFLVLSACSKTEQQAEEQKWSKPQRVMEGCEGVRSNSQQCEKNPNSQQFMIQIDRN